jgi:two-component system NarL family response regulator
MNEETAKASSGPIRVMLVDDHPIMRSGLRDVLESSGRVTVVGHAGDGEEAVRNVERLRPDVVVLDVLVPRKDGIDACPEIIDLAPTTRVLMLTASSSMDAVI